MRSFFDYVNLPSEIQITLYSLSVVLIISYFASGIDFGFLKIPTISNAKKKAALISGIVLLAASVVASQPIINPPKESIVTPVAYSADSVCAGDWIYRSRQSCDDASKPVFATVTDGDICGYETVSRTVQPDGYKSCRDISHGVERFANAEPVKQNSGRVGGGHSQPWWCQEMKNRYQAARPGLQIVWTNQTSGESSSKDWKGHVTYNYWCQVTAHWNPIYRLRATQACERLDPVVVEEQIAGTCKDETNPISYEQTQNASCDFDNRYETAPHARNARLAELFSQSRIDRPICVTCSALSENAEQHAQCLLGNIALFQTAEFKEPTVQSVLMSQIARSAETILHSDRYLESPTHDKLKAFLGELLD